MRQTTAYLKAFVHNESYKGLRLTSKLQQFRQSGRDPGLDTKRTMQEKHEKADVCPDTP